MLQTAPESADTLEAEITDEYLVYTMGDDILDQMECENGHICDESDYSYG